MALRLIRGELMPGPSSLKEILRELSKKVGFRLSPLDPKLMKGWEEAVGEIIARKAQPEGLRRGILWVRCPDPHWMNELQMLKETIKEKLNRLFEEGKVKDVRFKVGPLPSPPQEVPPRPEVPLSPEEVEAVLSPLQDESLRKSALKILKGIKERARGS